MDDIRDPPDLAQPPEPPELPRRIHLYRQQWVGIPLMLLIPLLALFRLFGERREHARVGTPELRVEVEYPGIMRRGQHSKIEIHVGNASGGVLDTVTVILDTAYINRFSQVSFAPEPRRAYEVELVGIPPAQTRLVRVEMEGMHSWRHAGQIAVTHGRADTARVAIATFVFP